MKLVEIDNELVANYDCQLLRESPNGKHLHFYYPGGTADGGKDGILLKIVPFHGDEWIGTFARDPTFPKSLTKVIFWTEPNKICVVSSGIGFVVNVNSPNEYEELNIVPIQYSKTFKEKGLVVLGCSTNFVAYDENGLLWKTERISLDGLRVTDAGDSSISGTYFDLRKGDNSVFTVDLASGRVHGGIGEIQRK